MCVTSGKPASQKASTPRCSLDLGASAADAEAVPVGEHDHCHAQAQRVRYFGRLGVNEVGLANFSCD